MDNIDKLIKDLNNNKETEIGINMEAKFSLYSIRKDVCEMCGEKPPTIVILDPNVFPENNYEKRDDFWDVCQECKEFIEWGMGKSVELFVESLEVE